MDAAPVITLYIDNGMHLTERGDILKIKNNVKRTHIKMCYITEINKLREINRIDYTPRNPPNNLYHNRTPNQ